MLKASQGLAYLTRDKECEFEIILGEEKNMREYSRLPTSSEKEELEGDWKRSHVFYFQDWTSLCKVEQDNN